MRLAFSVVSILAIIAAPFLGLGLTFGAYWLTGAEMTHVGWMVPWFLMTVAIMLLVGYLMRLIPGKKSQDGP